MALNWVDKVNGVDEILAEDINAIANEVVALSENAGGGGGFRKIGFTADCDFVATEGDGLTAFENAVNAASDGETFLVMPGVYKGVNQFDVVKNINFIGVGMPKIEFPVWISGGGVFNFESWSWDVLYPNVKSCWCGFSLLNNFIVGGTYNPDLVGYAGNAVLENCTVDGESVEITGEVRSCAFRCKYFNVGHYYDSEGAGGATLKDCSISATNNIEVYDGNFDSCEMFPPTSAVGKNISSSEFKKCKIFAVGTSIDVNDPRGSEGSFGDSIVFANSSNYGGYLVTPTAN